MAHQLHGMKQSMFPSVQCCLFFGEHVLQGYELKVAVFMHVHALVLSSACDDFMITDVCILYNHRNVNVYIYIYIVPDIHLEHHLEKCNKIYVGNKSYT